MPHGVNMFTIAPKHCFSFVLHHHVKEISLHTGDILRIFISNDSHREYLNIFKILNVENLPAPTGLFGKLPERHIVEATLSSFDELLLWQFRSFLVNYCPKYVWNLEALPCFKYNHPTLLAPLAPLIACLITCKGS